MAGTELQISETEKLKPDFFSNLVAALKDITGERWTVSTVRDAGALSLRERELAQEDAAKSAILNSPLIKAACEAFPDAELISYSAPEPRSLAS